MGAWSLRSPMMRNAGATWCCPPMGPDAETAAAAERAADLARARGAPEAAALLAEAAIRLTPPDRTADLIGA